MTSPLNARARMAISSATVPLHIATQFRTLRYSASFDSSSCTRGPSLVNQRSSSISLTRPMNVSRSPTFGRPTWTGLENAGGAPLMARSLLERMRLMGISGSDSSTDCISGRNWLHPRQHSLYHSSRSLYDAEPLPKYISGDTILPCCYRPLVAENSCVDWEQTVKPSPHLDHELDLNQPLPFPPIRGIRGRVESIGE